MFNFTRYDRPADQAVRMADALGADLPGRLQRGELPADQVRRGILRCFGCTDVDACEQWLDAHPEGASATPAYCRNQGLFLSLVT